MTSEPDLSLDQLIELERRAAERDQAEAAAASGGDSVDDDDADVIVLPWWQRPMHIVLIAVTAAALAGMTGWLIGDANAQPEHNAVDTGFLQDMREHHEQAVQMAWLLLEAPDTSPGVRTVARSIVRGQSLEVGRMIQLLRSWHAGEARDSGTPMDWMSDGHGDHPLELDVGAYDDEFSAMPGMATTAQLDALEASRGRQADTMFIDLMVTHHEAGIDMAEYAVEHAANSEVVAFAQSVVHSQQSEIVELENLRG